MIYFDNAATTRVCPEAAETAIKVMTEDFGNPSSSHEPGRRARDILEKARQQTADALGGQKSEVIFTSGGTEADNLAIIGAWTQKRGGRVITTAAEHDAVLNACRRLEALGAEVTYLKPDGKTGSVSPEAVESALREDTSLVSVMLVNNETGARNPVEEIAKVIKAKSPGAVFHTDAVQAFCKSPFSVKSLGADLVSVSGHKIHAPKGSGALWVRSGVKIKPLLYGGGQEKNLRPGTEALPSIAAFGTAAEIGAKKLHETEKHLLELRNFTLNALRSSIPDIVCVTEGQPSILPLSLPGYRSEVLLNFLDARGICVSKSSACKRGGRSHVLEAMGLSPKIIDGALRVSFSRENTQEEAKELVKALTEAVNTLAHR